MNKKALSRSVAPGGQFRMASLHLPGKSVSTLTKPVFKILLVDPAATAA